MSFVEFETQDGNPIWIQPKSVTSVEPWLEDDNYTVIGIGHDKYYIVLGKAQYLAQQISEAA